MENLNPKEIEAVKEMRKQILNAVDILQRQFQAYCVAKNTDSVPIVYINNCALSLKTEFGKVIDEALTSEQEKLIAMDQEDFPTSEAPDAN